VVHGVEAPAAAPGDPADARACLGLAGDGPVVGTVGNFTAKKDHATLIRALTRMAGDVRLVLVGLGPAEADLRALVAREGLGERVTFAGSRDDVAALLPAFDVFALSSRYEGLPIALLEAMAAGRACVATNVGGVPEVITDGEDGVLVAPGDPDALARALTTVLDDPARRADLGRRAAARAGDFRLDAAVARIEAVYDRVLARSPAARPA
jgi:glycosyltransferase involved in cell wall biosynthesis